MATKSTCKTLQKVADNEPIFVLRAQDVTAPDTIKFWLRQNPQITDDKWNEAATCAVAMRMWQNKRKAD